MKLISLLGSLFFVLSICKADDSTVEVFLGQTFRSEACKSAEAPPVWKIDDTDLIDALVINSYYGRVDRNPPNAPGEHWAILTLEHVNYTLNGRVLSCSTNPALNYTLVVVNTTIKWLAPNDSFRPPVCKSQLAESPPPNWMINGVVLDHTTINSRYGAEITRLSDDRKGRHQVKLTFHSVNTELIQNLSNISCAVGTELRMVYIILYNITGPGEEATPTPVTPGAGSTEKVVAGTSEALVNETSSSKSNNGGIIGGVTGVVILTLVVLAIVIIVYAFRKGWLNIRRRRRDPEADGEDDNEIDGIGHMHEPPPIEEEQQRERVESDSALLRKRMRSAN